MSRAVDTRRLYQFEEVNLLTYAKHNEAGSKARPLYWLQELALSIWFENNRHKRRWRCPEVAFGPGVFWCGQYQSYCLGNSYVELALGQRNAIVLIHEMTHVLGPGLHNRNFCHLNFDLLERYLGYDKTELEFHAAWHGIKL